MPLIDEDEAQSLRQAGGWFRQSFLPGFFRVLDQNLPSGVTRVGELRTLYESVDQLIEQCTFKDRRFADVKRRTELEDDLIPCAKRILITGDGTRLKLMRSTPQKLTINW